jgi:hypothetical protein
MSHLLEEYAKNLGVKIAQPIVKGHFFPLVGEKYITLSTEKEHGSQSYKYYNIVLDLVRPALNAHNIKIIQINGPPIKGIDILLNLTFKQQYFILSNSLLYLGNDGVLSHAASTLGAPTVNLFGNTFPSVNRPLFSAAKNNTNIAPEWKNKPCLSLKDPQQQINKIHPEVVAQAILDSLKIDHTPTFQTRYQGEQFGSSIVEVVPTSFSPLRIPASHQIFLRLDYGFDESAFLEFCKHHKVSLISDKLIQPHGLEKIAGNIQKLFVFIDSSWDTIPPNYFKVLKNHDIHCTLLVKDKKQLGGLKNKYFDVEVELFEQNEDKVEGLSPEARFLSTRRIIEGGKEYLSYAHWKKNLDKNNEVIDSPEYWRDLDHFYIYEQN